MSEMTVNEILRKTRKKLTDPARWMKGPLSAGGAGCVVNTIAMSFGTIGLALRGSQAIDAIQSVLCRLGIPMRVPRWNDAPDTTHADILMVLDMAIADTAGVSSDETVTEPVTEPAHELVMA